MDEVFFSRYLCVFDEFLSVFLFHYVFSPILEFSMSSFLEFSVED